MTPFRPTHYENPNILNSSFYGMTPRRMFNEPFSVPTFEPSEFYQEQVRMNHQLKRPNEPEDHSDEPPKKYYGINRRETH
jgi:hypothetical protein